MEAAARRAVAVEGGVGIALRGGALGAARGVGLVVVVLRAVERCWGSVRPQGDGRGCGWHCVGAGLTGVCVVTLVRGADDVAAGVVDVHPVSIDQMDCPVQLQCRRIAIQF